MKSAALAAVAVSMVCWPRLVLWPNRAYPVWYLEAVLLLGGFVLWAFVFAWHNKYAGRPVLTLKLAATPCAVATVAAIALGATLQGFVDPLFRATTPEDYPANLQQWFAMTVFGLAFNQLLLVFAPFDWSIRLFRQRCAAILFTVLFGVFVLVVKTRSSPVELPASSFWVLVVVRAATSLMSVWLYSRYGAMLVWWWGFLIQARHLVCLASDS